MRPRVRVRRAFQDTTSHGARDASLSHAHSFELQSRATPRRAVATTRPPRVSTETRDPRVFIRRDFRDWRATRGVALPEVRSNDRQTPSNNRQRDLAVRGHRARGGHLRSVGALDGEALRPEGVANDPRFVPLASKKRAERHEAERFTALTTNADDARGRRRRRDARRVSFPDDVLHARSVASRSIAIGSTSSLRVRRRARVPWRGRAPRWRYPRRRRGSSRCRAGPDRRRDARARVAGEQTRRFRRRGRRRDRTRETRASRFASRLHQHNSPVRVVTRTAGRVSSRAETRIDAGAPASSSARLTR